MISGGAELKIPLPFTDVNIILGLEGELFALGANLKIEDNKLKVGASAIVGGNIVFGFEKNEECEELFNE